MTIDIIYINDEQHTNKLSTIKTTTVGQKFDVLSAAWYSLLILQQLSPDEVRRETKGLRIGVDKKAAPFF